MNVFLLPMVLSSCADTPKSTVKQRKNVYLWHNFYLFGVFFNRQIGRLLSHQSVPMEYKKPLNVSIENIFQAKLVPHTYFTCSDHLII